MHFIFDAVSQIRWAVTRMAPLRFFTRVSTPGLARTASRFAVCDQSYLALITARWSARNSTSLVFSASILQTVQHDVNLRRVDRWQPTEPYRVKELCTRSSQRHQYCRRLYSSLPADRDTTVVCVKCR